MFTYIYGSVPRLYRLSNLACIKTNAAVLPKSGQ